MTEPPPKEQTEEGIAGDIAILLAAGIATQAMIATALLPLLPLSILRLPDLSADLGASVAELVLRGQKEGHKPSEADSGALLEDERYRALYAINALGRLVDAAKGDEDGREERLAKALQKEEAHFRGHLEHQEQRGAARRAVDALSETYRTKVLSWHHGPHTQTDRMNHRRADNKNFPVGVVPRETGGYPGALSGCKCYAGPPIEGASLMK